MKKLYIAGLMVVALSACKPNLTTTAPSAGSADFSRYLAVGNSLTAGYADGSLYRSGQQNSFPERLAEQFKLVGGGDFKQPLLPGESGFPSPKLVMGISKNCVGTIGLSPIPDQKWDTAGNSTNISADGPFNNFGIPGIRSVDYVTPGYATLAQILGFPYAARFFSNPSARPLDEALKINPTFFTLWLGNNDVLLYGTSGGAGSVIPITPVAQFEAAYDTVVAALTANGAKGVLINIPDITAIPYFTTVPANGLTLRQGQADSLTAAYAASGLTSITFHGGANYFVIQDASAPGGMRQLTDGEYVLLTIPQDSLICGGWGSMKPIPGKYVLTSDEVSAIETAITAYNQIIMDAATKYNLPYVDMNSYLKTVTSGIVFNGVEYNAQFVTGGAFSLDGVHLTPKGYALVANYIISNINAKYGATIPTIDINKYSGVLFP